MRVTPQLFFHNPLRLAIPSTSTPTPDFKILSNVVVSNPLHPLHQSVHPPPNPLSSTGSIRVRFPASQTPVCYSLLSHCIIEIPSQKLGFTFQCLALTPKGHLCLAHKSLGRDSRRQLSSFVLPIQESFLSSYPSVSFSSIVMHCAVFVIQSPFFRLLSSRILIFTP